MTIIALGIAYSIAYYTLEIIRNLKSLNIFLDEDDFHTSMILEHAEFVQVVMSSSKGWYSSWTAPGSK